jgi:hypothetical protein
MLSAITLGLMRVRRSAASITGIKVRDEGGSVRDE